MAFLALSNVIFVIITDIGTKIFFAIIWIVFTVLVAMQK
jgi:hypothetical protein